MFGVKENQLGKFQSRFVASDSIVILSEKLVLNLLSGGF